MLSDTTSRLGNRTVDDHISQFVDSKSKNIDYLLDGKRKLKEKLNLIKKIEFCGNCKKLLKNEFNKKNSSGEKKRHRRNQSVNVNRCVNETDNSFITEMEKDTSFNINNEETVNPIKKNLFKEFNKCESIQSNKDKVDKTVISKEKNPLVLTFKLNSDDNIKHPNGKIENWNITSNHCSNQTSKQNSPDIKFLPKTQFTFNNSNGSKEMENLRSINSESVYKDFVINEEISDFHTTNVNSSCDDNKFTEKPSKFKDINNEVIRSEISQDNRIRSIEEEEEVNKEDVIFNEGEGEKGYQENNSTPQFSTNKEAYQEMLSYQEIYKNQSSQEDKRKKSTDGKKLRSNKKFKEDDKKILEKMEVGKLNSDQKKVVFMKRKKSKEDKENMEDCKDVDNKDNRSSYTDVTNKDNRKNYTDVGNRNNRNNYNDIVHKDNRNNCVDTDNRDNRSNCVDTDNRSNCVDSDNKKVIGNKETVFSLKKNKKPSLEHSNNKTKEELYNESQDIIIEDSYTLTTNYKQNNKEKLEDSLIQQSPNFSRTENALLNKKEDMCSLDFENIKNIIDFYKKDLACTDDSRITESRKNSQLKIISQSKIISFSNMEETEKESCFKEEQIKEEQNIKHETTIDKINNTNIERKDNKEEDSNESVDKGKDDEETFFEKSDDKEKTAKKSKTLINSLENITTSEQRKKPSYLNTKDSFADLRMKDMLLSKTHTSGSNKKPVKQKICDTKFKTQSISFIKELSDEESKNSKNVITSKESIINKRNSQSKSRKFSLKESIQVIKESSVKSDLSDKKPFSRKGVQNSITDNDKDKQESHYHSFGSNNDNNSYLNPKEEQNKFIVSLKIPSTKKISYLEKEIKEKNNTYQNFQILNQSKRDNRASQFRRSNSITVSRQTQENYGEGLEDVSPIKKRNKSSFYQRSDIESKIYGTEQNRTVDCQDQTLKEVVNKINMISSEISDIKYSMNIKNPKEKNDVDIVQTKTQRSRRTNRDSLRKSAQLNYHKQEILKSLYEEDDSSEQMKDGDVKISYHYSTDKNIISRRKIEKESKKNDTSLLFDEKVSSIVEIKKTSFICLDLNDSSSEERKPSKQKRKIEEVIEVCNYQPNTSERRRKRKLVPVVKKSNKTVFFQDNVKEKKNRRLKDKSKSKGPVNLKKRKKSNRVSYGYGNVEKKNSVNKKTKGNKNNYYKLYMKSKNMKNENSSSIVNKTPKKRKKTISNNNNVNMERGANYPCIVDKQILKIKRSEVIIEKKFVGKSRKENDVSIVKSGKKNKYNGYQRDVSYEDLSNKKNLLVKKIEELEKSFEIY